MITDINKNNKKKREENNLKSKELSRDYFPR